MRSSVAEHGICQVVNYITKVTSNDSMSQNETTKFFPSNDALTAAENIRNNTCSWVSIVFACPEELKCLYSFARFLSCS